MVGIDDEARLRLESDGSGPIVLPDVRFDTVQAEKEGRKTATGLVVLQDVGQVEALLGRHNSGDPRKDGMWGLFSETARRGEDSSLDVLTRLVPEELGIFLPELEFYGSNQSRVVKEILVMNGGVPYQAAFYIVWLRDRAGAEYLVGETKPGYPHEIAERRFFPVRELLAGEMGLPLREFALPVLRSLDSEGFLDSSQAPLRPIIMPGS